MTGVTGRFDRQLIMSGFGPAEQERLGRATAMVAGIGGLGGTAATYLAAAGIGRLVLFHPGLLELPDLNRQTLMRPEWLGRERAECARETLNGYYPDVEIVAVNQGVGRELSSWLPEVEVVLDCRHNFPERFLLNSLCVAAGVPLVEAAMNEADGYLTVILPEETPCLKCLYPEGDPGWDPLGFPVLGAVSGTLGCLAAIEAIKLITGWGQPLKGRLLLLEMEGGNTRTLPVQRDPFCPVCRETAVEEGGDVITGIYQGGQAVAAPVHCKY